MSETTVTPGRRGTKPGTKQERSFERVCASCGVTFMGTARAVYCSRACNLRAWRARQPKPDADNVIDETVQSDAVIAGADDVIDESVESDAVIAGVDDVIDESVESDARIVEARERPRRRSRKAASV